MESTELQLTEAENQAKALVKVGETVCAWVRINKETMKIRAVVTSRHENGSVRVRYKHGNTSRMTECKMWRALTAEEKTRFKIK
jgi:hypothetical protein